MPPKIRVSKEQVLSTAFEMTREDGFEALTARKLAERLNSSTQPIFRTYENMDSLKEDLFYKCEEFYRDRMENSVNEFEPAYLSMSLKYIELAQSEYHLFSLLSAVSIHENDDTGIYLQNGDLKKVFKGLPDEKRLNEDQKTDLLKLLWIFTHGLASMIAGKRLIVENEGVSDMLKRAYEGFLNAETGDKSG
ncbi:MAG: TetR/AcrR family transcriptional regulator [Lachnospiraceae bacterium]|nr:TetR/AcrR family transcriptional regulator [Lachnospiraceae bacterium]